MEEVVELSVDSLSVCEEVDISKITAMLRKEGSVLVRSGVQDQTTFEHIAAEIITTPMVHHGVGSAQRDAVSADKTTATVDKGGSDIPLHREYGYSAHAPDVIMFYCDTPAAHAGETTLCDGVALLDQLPPSLKRWVEHITLCWHFEAPAQRWQIALRARTKEEALQHAAQYAHHYAAWEEQEVWFSGDILHGIYRVPCVIPTRWQQQQALCCYLFNFAFRTYDTHYAKPPLRLTLADGSPFPEEQLATLYHYAQRTTTACHWMPHDILLVDNSRFMHGRHAFRDMKRKLLVKMGHVTF